MKRIKKGSHMCDKIGVNFSGVEGCIDMYRVSLLDKEDDRILDKYTKDIRDDGGDIFIQMMPIGGAYFSASDAGKMDTRSDFSADYNLARAKEKIREQEEQSEDDKKFLNLYDRIEEACANFQEDNMFYSGLCDGETLGDMSHEMQEKFTEIFYGFVEFDDREGPQPWGGIFDHNKDFETNYAPVRYVAQKYWESIQEEVEALLAREEQEQE